MTAIEGLAPPEFPARTALQILRPLADPAALIEAQNRTREFVKDVLHEGVDYGLIPGTKGKSLLKPGAEKLTAGFGCVAVPRIIEQEIDHFREVAWTKRKKEWATGTDGRRAETMVETSGVSIGLYRYVVAVDIVDPRGIVRGTGLGSCSSLESKYCDRPRDVENTVLKQARKRAHVAGALDAFGLSNEFDDINESDADDVPSSAAASDTPMHPKGDVGDQGDRALFAKPFGSDRGTALADMDTKDLKGALDWNVRTCPTKYTDFQKEARAELERRAVRAEKELKQEQPAPEQRSFEDPPPSEPPDDLPF